MVFCMIEKEKMLAGDLYDTTDTVLNNERLKCKSLCYKYNMLSPEKAGERRELLAKILGRTGDDAYVIEQPFWCDYGYNIEVGKHFYANHNCIILDPAKVKFGDYVFIGPNCGFYTPQHPLDVETRNGFLEYAFPIIVGNNVWFGGNCVVLPGVTIGDNAVIAAGSVVVKDIPGNVVAAGNPCRVIREITPEDKFRFCKRK